MVLFAAKFLYAIRAVVGHVQTTPEWVVVVAADQETVQAAQRALLFLSPPDAQRGGRTLLMASGGRVTVTENHHQVRGENYLTMFLGFNRTLSSRDEIALHEWRHRQSGVVQFDPTSGELRINRE